MRRGVGGQPEIDVFLVDGGQVELVGVEPGQELDGDTDVGAVMRAGAGCVAAASRAAPGIANNTPFGERGDDGFLVRVIAG